MLIDKSYQMVETGVGSVHAKVKGAARLGTTLVDAQEIVRPPLEPNALFLTTNFLDTKAQSQSTCASIDRKDVCDSDDTCPMDQVSASRLGILTGR